MPSPSEILIGLDQDRFAEILSASPKQFREELFRVANIRVKGGKFSVKTVNKNRARADKFHAALKNGAEYQSDILEEIIRNYLYTRRSMLADALDHFGVEHDGGLTDDDLDFIDELDEPKIEALRNLLTEKHDPADVALYFAFMNIGG